MKEQLISFKTAKLAKEKGFNLKSKKGYYTYQKDIETALTEYKNPIDIDKSQECTFANACKPFANSDLPKDFLCTAPTQSLLQKWLRERHNLHIYIDTTSSFGDMQSHVSKYKALVKVPFKPFKWTTGKYYLGDTYEEALEKGLQEALKLITT